MAELKQMRNRAVDQCIWEYMKQEDPLLQDTQRDKIIQDRKRHIDEESMPDFVTVHLPCFEYEPEDDTFEPMNCEEIALKCLFTLHTVRIVHVECTADALTYVRCAIIKAAFEDHHRDNRKRSFTGVSGVRCDKRRKTVYVVVKASDMPNGTKRIQAKPDEWTDIFINQCANELKNTVLQQGQTIFYGGSDGDDGQSPEKDSGDGMSPDTSAAAAEHVDGSPVALP